MKKLLTIFVAAALMITALVGCQKAPPPEKMQNIDSYLFIKDNSSYKYYIVRSLFLRASRAVLQ